MSSISSLLSFISLTILSELQVLESSIVESFIEFLISFSILSEDQIFSLEVLLSSIRVMSILEFSLFQTLSLDSLAIFDRYQNSERSEI